MTPRRSPGPARPASHRPPGTGAGQVPPVRQPAEPTRVRVSAPADFLGLVPYLLGFCPKESLVLLLVRDGRVTLTARVDRPPPAAASTVAEQFLVLAGQADATGMVLFSYSADPEPARALLEHLVVELEPHGLVDALYVDHTRWWSLMCRGGCCPPEGTPYDLRTHPLAAEAVYAGLSMAPGRDDVEARVSGPAPADVDRLGRLARETASALGGLPVRRRQELMAADVAAFLAEPRGISDSDCVRLAVLAGDVQVRDVAWSRMSRADIDDHLDLWGQVVERAVTSWAPAPMCLLGMAAWISGNGALQNCCCSRARQCDPSYTMATLLEDINQRALPPTFWDELAAEVRAGVGPLAG